MSVFARVFAKLPISGVAMFVVSMPGLAQSRATGVSRPDPVEIVAQPDEVVTVKVAPAGGLKPSAAVPAATGSGTAGSGTAGSGTYGAYVPYRAAGSSAAVGRVADAGDASDVDAQIVMGVEEKEGELHEGTLLKVRMLDRLSTESTERGARFRAELTEPVVNAGRVALPAGSIVDGRVTQVHGGMRISGAAMLHLVPATVTLPDGTRYSLRAQLIDTDQEAHTKVDGEGSLVRRDHPKETLAMMGVATGGGAAAGALLGGGVGAAVGAGVGAGVSTVVWLKQDRQEVLPKEARMGFSLTETMDMTPVGAVGGRVPLTRHGMGAEAR